MNLTNYKFNTIQLLAVTGIALSLVAHLAILVVGRNIPNFWAVYPTWLGVFALGAIIKLFGNPTHEHTHDHDHDHKHDH